MEAEDSRTKISRLEGTSDWASWKFQMQIILEANEYADFISGEEPKPQRIPRAGETDAETDARFKNELKVWKLKDAKCKKTIISVVGKAPMLHLMSCESASDMWAKLHSVYEKTGVTSLHMIQKKFFEYKMSPEDDISTHISKLEQLGHQLKLLGAPVEESFMMTKLLMTLPPTYSHFHSAWDSEQNQTMDRLVVRLLTEETRLSEKDETEERVALMKKRFEEYRSSNEKRNISHIGRTSSRKEAGREESEPCFFCDKLGHWKKDCIHWKKKNQNWSSQENIACYNDISIAADGTKDNNWYVDSGASDHMSEQI
ncbi:hypothetical protein GE061_001798 [Apolygus lucorum]|uniref:CCHC-type domain-containing protein n=1 Tax=Apolygus lucorum TaxID=248454 RepID=A0A8S9X3B6_APOLU|nr:hypothetical protein GE061_001798 [Apolygus lucorum]